METELFYRLALDHIDGCGRATIKEMLRHAGSAENVFRKPELWRKHLNGKCARRINTAITDSTRRLVEKEMNAMERHGIKLRNCLDGGYPARLRRCADAPVQFFYKGDIDFNSPRTLAVVGTRNATSYGTRCVTKILNDLKGSGITTVSGLAYGIDTVAHEESVRLGIPTIAVMGSGFKNIYPSTNKSLASKILDCGGALVTEFPFDTGPDRTNFPQRNRIIAGMADAVLVAESGLKGGSIITAHIAHSYNRDVFAVPGSIFDATSQGCNNLIRGNVAAAATSGNDILEMMNWDVAAKERQMQLFVELSDEEEFLCSFIRDESRSIDEISEHCAGFSPSKIAGLLLSLELKGALTSLPGKHYMANR